MGKEEIKERFQDYFYFCYIDNVKIKEFNDLIYLATYEDLKGFDWLVDSVEQYKEKEVHALYDVALKEHQENFK